MPKSVPLRIKKFFDLKYCRERNCYVTDNKNLLTDITDFDAILFNSNHRDHIFDMNKDQLPQKRMPRQMYVFGEPESATNTIACNPNFENFFNWTWTYKLDSDIRWAYVIIYNWDGDEVGPKINMEWPKEMKPIEDKKTKAILDGKSKAAAWFVSNCKTLGGRENFVKKLLPELSKLHLTLDVYGQCGNLTCPISDKCFNRLKRDYYFYLSFENSFAPDYVTEKVITAFNNYAIPVVYGGANYSRFLPPGSYLNAHELGVRKLARTMKKIIENKTRFYDFFRWRNHFKYMPGLKSSEICNVCTALNEDKPSNLKLIDSFREWWMVGNPKRECNSNKYASLT